MTGLFSHNTDLNQGKGLLHRKEIFNKLQQSDAYPLTVVVAGAGFGKTVAVNTYLQQCANKIIWQQLTLLDNNVSRYWENFKRQLGILGPILSQKIKNVTFPDCSYKIDLFIELLGEFLLPGEKYTMVYDDFHLIKDKSLLFFVERLANACIPELSMIIISRVALPIHTMMLMAKGQLLEINKDDLRFSEAEMVEFFHKQQVYPSDSALLKIYQQTGGWIFALYLIAHSLKQKPIAEDLALAAMKLNIQKVIETEIFHPLAEVVQRFLIKLSLFENFRQELLELMSGGDNQLIEAFNNITSFIRFDVFTNTYVIHHLFLDFLAQKQQLLSEIEKKEIYVAAATWYENNNHKFDAINYYQKAKEYDKMILTMASFSINTTPIIAKNFVSIFDETIPQMGEQKFWAMIIRLRFQFELKEAECLIERLKQLPSSPKSNYLFFCVYLITAYRLLLEEGEGFAEYFRLATQTGAQAILKPRLSLKSYACVRRSTQAHKFGEYFKEMALTVVYTEKNDIKNMGYGFSDLCRAEYAFFQRDFKVATQHAYFATVKAQEAKEFYIEDMAYFYLMRIRVAQGNYEGVQQILQHLKQQLEKYQYPDYYTMYTVASDWFHVLMGHPEKSSIWQSKHVLSVESMTTTHAFGWFQLVIARCYWAEERYEELYPYLCSLDNQSVSKDFLMGEIEVTAFKAVTLFRLNKKEDSVETLKKAYELAHINNFMMPFTELGNGIISLVKYALKSKQTAENFIPEQWLSEVQKKASAYAKKVSFLVNTEHQASGSEHETAQRLTKKELDCLQDLCKGLSRAQIAADRNLSENYVKLMLQNIYTKLGVKNSKEAIRAATAQNLL